MLDPFLHALVGEGSRRGALAIPALALFAAGGAPREEKTVPTSNQSIDVNVPVRTAYDQWTQFESFPEFMEGVVAVRQVDATHLHWKATVGGKPQEWDAEIDEQIPDQKVAWHSTEGDLNAGVVTFNRLGADQTRVLLSLEYEPRGVLENTGAALGFLDRRVKGDLERFKAFIEGRGAGGETGAWRGTVGDHPETGGLEATGPETGGLEADMRA